MKILRRLNFCDECPRWWGFCWDDQSRRDSVIAPMPLNLLIAAAYWLWLAAGTPGTIMNHISYMRLARERQRLELKLAEAERKCDWHQRRAQDAEKETHS